MVLPPCRCPSDRGGSEAPPTEIAPPRAFWHDLGMGGISGARFLPAALGLAVAAAGAAACHRGPAGANADAGAASSATAAAAASGTPIAPGQAPAPGQTAAPAPGDPL